MGLPQAPATERPAQSSPWSWRVATVSGIPVRLHASFLVFLIWAALVGGQEGALFILAVFLCVLLHEFGHALVARRYGVGTRDITLYPVGGVATLRGRLAPREEFWVTLAGPLTNLVLAGLFFAAGLAGLSDAIVVPMLATNLTMAIFNLVPAFPMDGGRILRSLLAMRLSTVRATRIAARVGQVVAALLLVFAIVKGEFFVALIAMFVFTAAGAESRSETVRALMNGHRAVEAMVPSPIVLPHAATVGQAAELLVSGRQTDFPVVAGEEPIGVLTREDISYGVSTLGSHAYIAGLVRRDYRSVAADAPLEQIIEMFTPADDRPLLVMSDERLVGMITVRSLSDYLSREYDRRARLL